MTITKTQAKELNTLIEKARRAEWTAGVADAMTDDASKQIELSDKAFNKVHAYMAKLTEPEPEPDPSLNPVAIVHNQNVHGSAIGRMPGF